MARAKILVVEDEFLVGEDLRARLESLNYAVTTVVPSGERAVEMAGQDRPDLVLMDIRLSGPMDGLEAAGLIHSRWRIPIVFVTAYLDSDRLERLLLTGTSGYLIKPFQDGQLQASIEAALRKN